MSKNPEWFAQQRARGLCYLCRRPMPDTDPRLAHRGCYRLQTLGYRAAQIRALRAREEATRARA